jgi:NAD(P)H-hydrate epimerase
MGVLSEKAADVLRDELSGYDALLLGPGWGRENTTRTLLTELFNQQVEGRRSKRPIGFLSSKSGKPEESEQAHNEFPPLVVDADALNLLSEIDEWWKYLPANTIITPHPGEMARLAKVETAEIQANRTEIAQQKAAAWQVIVMLKGAHTVIAAPDGRTALLPFKSDALAKAGTGDVLAGTIVGLLAQGLAPFDAAVVGGYLHGLAGTLAASRSSRSVVAHDVVEALPAAFKALGK